MDIISLLVERGKEPPPPLGGLEDGDGEATSKFGKLHVPCVCTLIQCCIAMLSSPYHVQVVAFFLLSSLCFTYKPCDLMFLCVLYGQ